MELSVVVPAHRPELPNVRAAIERIPRATFYVVTNGPDPIQEHEVDAHVVSDTGSDINISRWWNLGIDAARERSLCNILVLNSDAVITEEQATALHRAALDLRLSITHPDQYGLNFPGEVVIERRPMLPLDLHARMTGYAFLLSWRSELRADEQFRWWFGDDDLEWRARDESGVGRVAGVQVRHSSVGGSLVDLEDVVREDRRRFVAKWGLAPHPFGPGGDA